LESKEKIDLIAKQSEIINKKLIANLAIASGTWIYGLKEGDIIGFLSLFFFVLSAFGIGLNMLKLGQLFNELQELKNE